MNTRWCLLPLLRSCCGCCCVDVDSNGCNITKHFARGSQARQQHRKKQRERGNQHIRTRHMGISPATVKSCLYLSTSTYSRQVGANYEVTSGERKPRKEQARAEPSLLGTRVGSLKVHQKIQCKRRNGRGGIKSWEYDQRTHYSA